jgi:hypothetical protein
MGMPVLSANELLLAAIFCMNRILYPLPLKGEEAGYKFHGTSYQAVKYNTKVKQNSLFLNKNKYK